MYRNFISPYYPPYGGYQYLPYNLYRGYVYTPYSNYINSQIARTDQNIYNSGVMSDVFQESNIMQSGVGICTDIVPNP